MSQKEEADAKEFRGRFDPVLHQKIKCAAKISFRSMSAEVSYRLEAELTTGQGRALSGHRTDRAYGGYAKRTMERALAATRKRYAHLLANAEGTKFQNEGRNAFQNDGTDDDQAIA